MSQKKKKQTSPPSEIQTQGRFTRNLPWIITGVMALWLLSKAFTVPKKAFQGMDMHGFGRLPVVESGRVKPYDSLARNYLILMSERQTVIEMVEDHRGREKEVKRPAIKWLLDTLSGSPAAAKYRIFRIESLHVLQTLGLTPRHGFRYTLEEIVPRLPELIGEAIKARQKKEADKTLSPDEEQFHELGMHLQRYISLTAFIVPHIIPPVDDHDWQSLGGMLANNRDKRRVEGIMQERVMMVLREGDINKLTQTQADMLSGLRDSGMEPVNHWGSMLLAWQKNDAQGFNTSIGKYREWLRKNNVRLEEGNTQWRADKERLDQAIAKLKADGGESKNREAIKDFESERKPKPAPVVGDTGFEVSYNHIEPFATSAAMYLIGFLLICASWLFGAPVDEERIKSTGRLIFGIVCFALLLSFVGTVLGGLWADDSWGRFWGWDPKENGALMIVLWNAIILHARLGGMIQARGLALLSLGGNMITAWSWFGVNQLGKGLHSYGFTSGITFWLLVFVTSQIAFILIGSMPRKYWFTASDSSKPSTAALSMVLNRAAFNLIAFTFVVHTFGLVARIWISGYPPVTTLYSSAIFIGWGAVILGLVLERLQRSQPGIGNAIAAVGGFSTLLVAHFLAIGDGDTFTMMQAVLDTRFWLATHVTTVTLGYMATFVAGGLGMYLLFRSNRWCVGGLGVFCLLWALGGLVVRSKWGIEYPSIAVGDNLLVNPLYIFLWVGLILTAAGWYRLSQVKN